MNALLVHDPSVLFHVVKKRLGKVIFVDPSSRRAKYFEPDSAQWWRKGECPKRDSFKQRCYDAENRFAEKIEQRTFANITEVAKYVRDFMEKPWFQRRFPWFEQCHVEYRPGSVAAKGGPRTYHPGLLYNQREVTSGSIEMSSWAMGNKGNAGGEIVVLHELAHAVLPAAHSHDRRWVRTYTEFIGCAMGQNVKKMLLEELKLERVPYSPMKRINFSEEHMQRLAASRPKKGGSR